MDFEEREVDLLTPPLPTNHHSTDTASFLPPQVDH